MLLNFWTINVVEVKIQPTDSLYYSTLRRRRWTEWFFISTVLEKSSLNGTDGIICQSRNKKLHKIHPRVQRMKKRCFTLNQGERNHGELLQQWQVSCYWPVQNLTRHCATCPTTVHWVK